MHNHNKRISLPVPHLSWLVLFFFLVGSIYALNINTLAEENDIPLPRDIQNIRIGVSLEKFVTLREKTAHFGLFEDEKIDLNKPDEKLIENFGGNSLFDLALYDFEEFSLSGIVLLAERPDPKNQHRNLFLKQILELYGDPDEIVVVYEPIKEAYNAPGLIWRRKNLLLMADFTLDFPEKRSGYYQFKIFDINTKSPKPLYMAPVLKESEKAKIIAATDSLLASLR